MTTTALTTELTAADTVLHDFLQHEYSRVVAAVGLITGARQDADDAVQDALLGYLAEPPARPVQNLAAWVTVVASNRVRDRLRRRGAEDRALAQAGTSAGIGADAAHGASEGQFSLDVDIATALRQLPAQQRQVCVLHYLLDQSVEQVADGLRVTPGTVKTQLSRARRALAARLTQEVRHG